MPPEKWVGRLRDREGTVETRIVEKRQRRLTDVDEIVS